MERNKKRRIVVGLAATGFLAIALLLACGALSSDGDGEEIITSSSNPALEVKNFGSGDALTCYASGAGIGIRGRSELNDGVVGWTAANAKSGVYGFSYMGAGVTGRSEALEGRGVAGTATADRGIGVYGFAAALDGVGVFGQSDLGRGVEGRTTSNNEWVPAIYGKNVGAGDGVYGWSQSRHGTVGVTSSQNPDHAGLYGTNNGAGPAMKAEGDLIVTGAYRGNIGPNGGASFPLPAFDSGWEHINKGERYYLNHDIGGNPDTYVVDIEFKSTDDGINKMCTNSGGVGWFGLTNKQIGVYRGPDDDHAQYVRVRIWVYKQENLPLPLPPVIIP
jgi:hypothetical protein